MYFVIMYSMINLETGYDIGHILRLLSEDVVVLCYLKDLGI